MNRLHRFLMIILVAVLATGCSQSNAVETSTGVPGSGASASLSDPTQGLASLPAYRATFTLSFDGTQVGQTSRWSQKYILNVDSASKARLMSYSETGLDPEYTAYPALDGAMNGVVYLKNIPTDTCVASFADAIFDPAALPEPAGMLPKLKNMSSSGAAEMINSISALPYTFDASAVTDLSTPQATGKVWLAADGNYVVRYSLELTGGTDFFDQDTEGKMTWDYQLEPLNPAGATLLPADCPLPLPSFPIMENASNIINFPGILRYETADDIQAVADFYISTLPGQGFVQAGDARIGSLNASLSFSKGTGTYDILVESGTPNTVNITAEAAASASAAAVPTPTTSAAGNAVARVSQTQTLLLGSSDTPSVFASYHLDYSNLSSKWSNGAVTQSSYTLSADVQGKNIHFTETTDGVTTEVILIGDTEYDVINGQAAPGSGLAGLDWITWPLDPAMVLGIGSLKTEAAGTDTLDSRPVEVYTITGKISDDTTGMFASLTGVTAVSGQVCVDQATGGLVKMTADYEADVKDNSGSQAGHGSGHIEINVTQIGNVTVTPPK